jgi:dCMP deaminase
MNDISITWKKRYLSLASEIAQWSKDPRTKVGAVAVGGVGQILATGFNGFPRNIQDSDYRLKVREIKNKLVVHAEQNCIYNATINGVSLEGSTLFVSGLHICRECAKGIIQVGISKVVLSQLEIVKEGWEESIQEAKDMMLEAGVVIEEI